MKLVFRFYLYPICLALLFLFQQAGAQSISAALSQAVPQAKENLNSNEIRERISVLQAIVIDKPDDDVVELILPFNLSHSDYAFVIKKILEKDLLRADANLSSEAFYKIEFLIRKFKLKEFAKPLAEYLTEFKVNEQNWMYVSGRQLGILETLKVLKAKETDSQIFPLLQSPRENIRREALRTLAEIGSEKAIPPLVKQLSDKDYLQRFYAIQSLVKLDAKETSAEIAKRLGDENPNIRYWAVDALVKLDAEKQSSKIWSLVNSGQTSQTEDFAVAALVYFGDKRAIDLVVDRLKNVDSTRLGETAQFIVKIKATAIAPALVKVLRDNEDYSLKGREYIDFRLPIINLLNDLGKRDSISVSILRKIIRNEQLPSMYEAMDILGRLESREAVDDLLNVFYRHLPNLGKPPCDDKSRGICDSDDTFSINAAMALAKIGGKKAWKSIIDFAGNPKFFLRNESIIELNQQLDRNLWRKIKAYNIPASEEGYKTIRETIDLIGKSLKVPVVLEIDRNDFGCRQPEGSPPDKDKRGSLFQFYGNAADILYRITSRTVGYCDVSEGYTIIFDNGTIRILPISKAVEWWRKHILNK